MSKKNINDDDFFDDANIEAMAEDIPMVDPDLDGEGGDADASVESDESVDATDDEAPAEDAPGDDAGEDAGDDAVADGESEADAGDPAPQLTDLESAKIAYAELRKWANQRDMAARKNEERIAELEAIPEYDYYEEPPAYDGQAFLQMAAQDTRQAFQFAMQAGQDTDARAAIAQTQADAQELASMAAIAYRDGDKDAYAQLRAQSINANAQAQQMEGELATALTRRQQAPLEAAERSRNQVAAEARLAQETNGDYTARIPQVVAVLQENPTLIRDHSAEGIYKGILNAYKIAKDSPAPVAAASGPSLEDLDRLVEEKLAERSKQIRKAKAEAAEAAQGAPEGRSGSAAKSAEPGLKEQLYASAKQQSVGARGFMALGQ